MKSDLERNSLKARLGALGFAGCVMSSTCLMKRTLKTILPDIAVDWNEQMARTPVEKNCRVVLRC